MAGWSLSLSHCVVASFKLISCFAAFAFEKTRKGKTDAAYLSVTDLWLSCSMSDETNETNQVCKEEKILLFFQKSI